ncbi:MAG: amidohydrolase [Alphaproteobacteria bacterium]|nr:amidohydrolase [Alphaproteobacteria bacterium]
MDEPRAIDLLIEGGVVVTVDADRRVIADGAVAVDGGRIVDVGKAAELAPRFSPANRTSARDQIVMPGLVDAHVHITAEHLCRGLALDDAGHRWMFDYALPLYGAITPEEEYAGARLACLEMLRNGTTSFHEGGTARDVEASARAVEEAGLAGTLTPWTWDLPQEPTALNLSREVALERTEAAIGRFHGAADGRLRIAASCINPVLCSAGLLGDLKALADDKGVTFTFHHASSIEPVEAFVAAEGRRPLLAFADLGILDENVLATHMVHLDDDELAVFAASGASIAHCPQTALRLAYGAATHGRFPELIAAGVTIGLGTDGVMSSDNQDLFKAMQIAAGLYKDARSDPTLLPAEKVVEMATIDAARAIGLEAEVGSLEIGKRADLILLDRQTPELTPLLDVANALVYATDGRNVASVMVAGRLLMDRRQVLTLDADALYAEVREMAPRLMERAGLGRRARWPIL